MVSVRPGKLTEMSAEVKKGEVQHELVASVKAAGYGQNGSVETGIEIVSDLDRANFGAGKPMPL